jgi:hypothetical protein
MLSDDYLTQLAWQLEHLSRFASVPQAEHLVRRQMELAREFGWSDELEAQALTVENAVVAFVKAGAVQRSEAGRTMHAELAELKRMAAELDGPKLA